MKFLNLSHDSVLVRSSEILSSDIDSETILLSIKNSRYYGLETTGSRIWALLQTSIRYQDLIQALLDEFDVDETQCKQEVELFLAHLYEEGLLEVTHE